MSLVSLSDTNGFVFSAASEGRTEIVKFFEQHMKLDITYPKHAPLLAAIENGHTTTAEAMLENYRMAGRLFLLFDS